MKRKLLQLISLLFLAVSGSFAQCPGCNIDTTLTSPGIYPNVLPTATQMQPYSEDVTFVMFTDTSGFSVNYFKIIGVTGLPFGLHWECNNSASGCQYDPSVNIRGCVKICGTPLQSGFFTMDVNVIVNLQTVGNVNSTTQISIQIDPAAGGNSGFSFTPAQSCDTALVTFNGLIDGTPNPTTYTWNFGNGHTSTLQNPAPELYSTPGDYYVTLQTDIIGYKITDVNLFSVNGNWSGDAEEPSSSFFDPDPYFEIYNSLSTNLYTAPSLSGTQSGSWNSLNILLTDAPYSITIWDEDNVSVNDNLGSFPFTVLGPGTIPFSGAGGTSGNIVVASYVIQSFTNVDTIHVFAVPNLATVLLTGSDTICTGDSVTLQLVGAGTNLIQWYNDTTALVNADSTFITVNQTGNYWAQLTNLNGCTSATNVQSLFVASRPLNPTFLINVNDLTCFSSGGTLQWNLNGSPIGGANASVYQISQTGSYSVTETNSFGCSSTSIAVIATYVGIDELDALNHASVFPNPSTADFMIKGDKQLVGMNYTITDNIGRVVSKGVLEEMETKISLGEVEKGVYFLSVSGQSQKTFKLIKN